MAWWWNRRRDLILGLMLGVAIGLAVVALFVFVFSEQAVDAPSIDNSQPSTTPAVPGPVPNGNQSQAPKASP